MSAPVSGMITVTGKPSSLIASNPSSAINEFLNPAYCNNHQARAAKGLPPSS